MNLQVRHGLPQPRMLTPGSRPLSHPLSRALAHVLGLWLVTASEVYLVNRFIRWGWYGDGWPCYVNPRDEVWIDIVAALTVIPVALLAGILLFVVSFSRTRSPHTTQRFSVFLWVLVTAWTPVLLFRSCFFAPV